MKIYKTGIRQNFEIWGCDMAKEMTKNDIYDMVNISE